MDLIDKRILITGSSGGIGSALANRLETESVKVIRHVSKDAKGETEFAADFSNPEQIFHMFKNIQDKYGHLDGLINTVGIEESDEDQLDTAKWHHMFAVNLFGAAEATRQAIKLMPKGGVIIHTSSIMGNEGIVGESSLAYSLTKTALQKLTANLSLMHVSKNMRFISVSPGYTDTPIWQSFDAVSKQQAINDVPIKRFIKPEEIADFIVAVIKNDAITGVNLSITGGLHLKSII